MNPLVPQAIERPTSLPCTTAWTNTGEIVLSPSETRLMPLTPISAQSSRKSVITSLVIVWRSFSWSMA